MNNAGGNHFDNFDNDNLDKQQAAAVEAQPLMFGAIRHLGGGNVKCRLPQVNVVKVVIVKGRQSQKALQPHSSKKVCNVLSPYCLPPTAEYPKYYQPTLRNAAKKTT